MATAKPPRTGALPPLENGDRLDQKTFHARYAAMPEDCRAELIGGIVYMASPQKVPHSKAQKLVIRWLDEYAEATPGTEALLNNTQILGPDSEPEPDACLFIAPEYGGQVYVDADDYLNGAPELVVEVSSSTESIDLHRKKDDYQKAGVREYVVLALRMQQVFWFVRQRGKYKEVPLPGDDIFARACFPGCGSTRRPCYATNANVCWRPSGGAWRARRMWPSWRSWRSKRLGSVPQFAAGARADTSVSGSTGLVRCSSNPAARDRDWSSAEPYPVTAITRAAAVAGLRRSALTTP
jgi:Uma2 family endonuclease